MLVTIKKGSVRKNPDARSRVTRVPLGVDINFKSTIGNLPKCLKDDGEENWTWTCMDKGVVVEGIIFTPELAEAALDEAESVEGFSLHWDNRIATYHHIKPEPSWLFSYNNPSVECDSCGSTVRVDDINSDSCDYTGATYDSCPICNDVDTFPEREYETIEEFLKRNKK